MGSLVTTPVDPPATGSSVVPVIIETSASVIEVEVDPAHALERTTVKHVDGAISMAGMDVVRRIQAGQTNDREQLLAPVMIARIYRK